MKKLVLLLIALLSFSFLNFRDNSSIKFKHVNDKVMVGEDVGKYAIGTVNLKLKESIEAVSNNKFGIN